MAGLQEYLRNTIGQNPIARTIAGGVKTVADAGTAAGNALLLGQAGRVYGTLGAIAGGDYEAGRAYGQGLVDKAYKDSPVAANLGNIAGSVGLAGGAGLLAKGALKTAGGVVNLAKLAAGKEATGAVAKIAGSKIGKGAGLLALGIAPSVLGNGSPAPAKKQEAATTQSLTQAQPQKVDEQRAAAIRALTQLPKSVLPLIAQQRQPSAKDQLVGVLSNAIQNKFLAASQKYAPGSAEYQAAEEEFLRNALSIASPQGVPYVTSGE